MGNESMKILVRAGVGSLWTMGLVMNLGGCASSKARDTIQGRAPATVEDSLCESIAQFKDSFRLGDTPMTPDTIKGASYPRNERILYRGVEKNSSQFWLTDIARIAFGDETHFIGSLGYAAVLQGLENRQASADSVSASGSTRAVNWGWNSDLYAQMGNVIRQCPTELESRPFRSLAAAYLVNRHFESEFSSFKTRLLDYLADGYINYSPEVTFTSVYSPVSLRAGLKVMMLKNDSRRGIDLGYFNYQRNGKRWFGPWGDYGEFIFPGYLRSEIFGMIYGTGNSDGGTYADARKFDVAFIRDAHFPTRMSVIDLRGRDCFAEKNGAWYGCQQTFLQVSDRFLCTREGQPQVCPHAERVGADAPPPTPDLSQPLPVVGYLVSCPETGECKTGITSHAFPADARSPLSLIPEDDRNHLKRLHFEVTATHEKRMVLLYGVDGKQIPLE